MDSIGLFVMSATGSYTQNECGSRVQFALNNFVFRALQNNLACTSGLLASFTMNV